MVVASLVCAILSAEVFEKSCGEPYASNRQVK